MKICNLIKKEIISSGDRIEEILGIEVEHFAYPFGTVNEADTREFELAYRCGFRTALTTRPEIIRTPFPLNAIPRLGVPVNLNRLGIKGFLSGWVHLIRKFL